MLFSFLQSPVRRFALLALVAATIIVAVSVPAGIRRPATTALAAPSASSSQPNFGQSVYIFNPTMSQSDIQATVDAVANQQVSNQFGTQRYALLFEPGTYGASTNPLNFQVGYYTTVAGLGLSPNDVVINGSIYVRNQCFSGSCTALNNFWRSLSNLTINVTTPNFGCYNGEFWAVSQAAPMRRVHVNGFATLMDYCTQPSFASGGFIADSRFNGTIVNGSQQQWLVRNSSLVDWTNGVWNQVFSGVVGAPSECFPAQASCGGPYTTLPKSRVTREAPYLYVDSDGNQNVFVPSVQTSSSGPTWADGATPGTSVPIDRFYVAKPSDSAATINSALRTGRNLILTPGNSPVLLQVGSGHARSDNESSDPPTLSDVFFRIGGAEPGSATTSLVVNSNNVILDDIWAWRADHGNGVGWTSNTADTGVIVNGDNVTAYGLFVEHYQKYETIWNGNSGTVVFFQNEMPYDPPSQVEWMEAPGVDGWAAFKVGDGVTSFHGYGMGSYSFFNQGVNIYAAHAFEVPATLPPGSLHNLLTVFLDPSHGLGGILNVVNDTGGSSTIVNPDVPVTVVNYP